MAGTADPWRRWEWIRESGRGRFVLVYGVCGWGLTTGALCSIALWYFTSPVPIGPILSSLLLFPAGGALWGAIMWSSIEARYLAARDAERLSKNVQRLQDDVQRLEEEVDQLRSLSPAPKDTNITRPSI
jgi:hypothetical protein